MKRQIRGSVFETNSSSMHSLVILKDSVMNKRHSVNEGVYLDESGVWEIWDEEDLRFERYPFNCLSRFEEKVRYAIASLCGYRVNASEVFEDIKKIVFEVWPKCKDIKLPHKWDWDIDDDKEEDKIFYGNVDEDILSGFLKENNIELKDFLTDGKYIVIVDGDEYHIFDHMKKCGIINIDNIESEYN